MSDDIVERVKAFLPLPHSANSKAHPLLEELLGEVEDMRRTEALNYDCAMRAVKLWQKAHPDQEATWPDYTSLLLWLMEEKLCEHGKLLTDYCEPCGRINSA